MALLCAADAAATAAVDIIGDGDDGIDCAGRIYALVCLHAFLLQPLLTLSSCYLSDHDFHDHAISGSMTVTP